MSNLHWFPDLSTKGPYSLGFTEFDMSGIRPKDVKAALKNTNHGSCPGPDGIPFGILFHLPSTHSTLATLFSQVLCHGIPPKSWAQSYISLIHKAGPADKPGNFCPIALGNTIGKLFHLIIAKRMSSYLLHNGLIDKNIQKAFLPGVSGCIEHTRVLTEVVKAARMKKKTIHVAFFDLEDAFGSVPHDLIMSSLSRNFFPPKFIQYLNFHYRNLESCIVTKSWKTDTFAFKRGVVQGCPVSPLIFLITFNPIIQWLESQKKFRFDLSNGESEHFESNIITLPFADDFCLISTNERTQRRLIQEIDSKIRSMGLRLKPIKCRSFSVVSGKSKSVSFSIGDQLIPTIQEKEQKFQGKVLFFFGTEAETLIYLKDKFSKMLDYLDNSPVRMEYKIWIYKCYFLASIRFLLTIHTLTASSLAQLDAITSKYLKKWCGLPKCAMLEILYSHRSLNISRISELYTLCHTLEICNVRTVSDKTVNLAVDNAIIRENSNLKLKYKTETSAQLVFSEALAQASSSAVPNISIIKNKAKQILNSSVKADSEAKLESLVLQGGLLGQMVKLKTSPAWVAELTCLKTGSLKFILNSHINTLPTMDNLFRWGITKTDKCVLCSARDSTYHLLSTCSVSLQQGRFKWRHDNILSYLLTLFKGSAKSITADLPEGKKYGGSTISPHLLVTSKVPDLVVEDKDTVTIIELTSPFEPNLEARHTDKMLKYDFFNSAITAKKCIVICLEIGARGLVCPRNKETLKQIYHLTNKKHSVKEMIKNCSSLASTSSQFLFTQRKVKLWNQETPTIRLI